MQVIRLEGEDMKNADPTCSYLPPLPPCSCIQSSDLVASSSKNMSSDDGHRSEHESQVDFGENSFPVFALPGSLETLQKLKPGSKQDGSDPSLEWPETRIGRWSYTVVPWED